MSAVRLAGLLAALLAARSPAAPPPAAGPGLAPAPGRLLVARRELPDPGFRDTVVLLAAYDEAGALGVVLNRPAGVRLAAALPGVEELRGRLDELFLGGPVEPARLLLLVRSPGAVPEGGRLVAADLYLTGGVAPLPGLLARPDLRFRAFAGYAAWAPRQLDGEVGRHDWHLLEADAESVFTADPQGLWRRLLERAEARWAVHPVAAPAAVARAAPASGGWVPGARR